jgi:hypothetical protein
MPSFPITDRVRDHLANAIRHGVNKRLDKMMHTYVPPFPFTSTRVEQLINTPEIMDAVYKLRTVSFARFKTIKCITLGIGGCADRGIVMNLMVDNIICQQEFRTVSYSTPFDSAYGVSAKLRSDYMTDDERAALRDWTDAAVKYRRHQRMVACTVEEVLSNATTTYELSCSWPLLVNMIDWNDLGNRIPGWRSKLTDRPRKPEAYDICKNFIPEDDIHKRIDVAEMILLKSEFLPERKRGGSAFELLAWEMKPGDPAWLTSG